MPDLHNDPVDRPAHYTDGDIECIDAIKASMTPEEFRGFLKGSTIKYLWRYRLKGHPVQDLKKAKWYLKRLTKEVEEKMKVELIGRPTEADWVEVKRRALVTIGREAITPPTTAWKVGILRARHSPIRRLVFSFLIECPYWVSVHLCRHHAGVQPYVRSQRNDRQAMYDRNMAPQDAPVTMIMDLNAEALLTLANKRLCRQASEETRAVVQKMCDLAAEACPEIRSELVPMCVRNGGICYEMHSCKEGKGNG